MRKVIEALRLRFDQGLSQRAIAQTLGLAPGRVNAYLARFAASGLSGPLPPELDEAALEARLGTRVAAHPQSPQTGRATIAPTHRPKSHQRHLEWSPARLIAWGERIGPSTGRVVAEILARFPHPEPGYRACLGLFSLARRSRPARLEAASTRALATKAIGYRSIKSTLTTGVDQLPLDESLGSASSVRLPATHAHVRGPAYYRHALAPLASLAAGEHGTAIPAHSALTPHAEDRSQAD